MKRRYKLLIIIFLGALITCIIYFSTQKEKTHIVAIGDGVALGMTPYNLVGISYNDYLKEYYESKNNLASFNNEFCISHLTIDKLLSYLEKNSKGAKTNKYLKQSIEQADILTLAIGVDEFADISLRTNDYDKYITDYILNYKNVLSTIRSFYDKKIIILGVYPAAKFSKNETLIVNKELQKVAQNYKAEYLDLFALSLKKEYYLQPQSYYLNYKAHQKIFRDMLTLLKEK